MKASIGRNCSAFKIISFKRITKLSREDDGRVRSFALNERIKSVTSEIAVSGHFKKKSVKVHIDTNFT
jgi:hypothetical protein